MGELRGQSVIFGKAAIEFLSSLSKPGKIKPGTVSDEVVNQVDIMATVASIIDYKLPNETAVDSYNLLPVLKGETYNKPLREATQFKTPNQINMLFARRLGISEYLLR